MKNIDWTARTYDYYVNGALQRTGAKLEGTAQGILSRIDLAVYTAGTSAYWDEILFK